MIADDLQETGARYVRAQARADALREQRDALVREALSKGWTHAVIAELAGMTRGRVGQIAMAVNRPPEPCDSARATP